jgi:hypothetical protein
MRSRLDPLVHSEWHEYYRAAEKRRRRAGWHRRGDSPSRKRGLDSSKVLAIVMGLATVTVILCLVLPT